MNVNGQTSVEFLNYWTTTLRLQYNPWTEDDRLTRGGPMARSPSRLSGRLNLNSDSRRPLVGRANYSWGSDARGGWNRQVQLALSGRFDEILQVNLGPRYSWSHSTAQYVTAVAATELFPARYVFAGIDQSTLSLETRVNVTFTPDLSLQLYLEPFIATGDYGALKEFLAPGTFEFLEYGVDRGTVSSVGAGAVEVDPDGSGPATAFAVSDRDFSYRSLLGNAVLRWEWRSGSTLFFVWQQRRISSLVGPGPGSGRPWVGHFDLARDAGDMFEVAPDNIFMVKLNYWLNP